MTYNLNPNLSQPIGRTTPACPDVVDESAITEAALLAELSEPDALEELELVNARLQRIGTQLGEQTSAIREQTTVLEDSTRASYEIARHLDRMVSDGRKARVGQLRPVSPQAHRAERLAFERGRITPGDLSESLSLSATQAAEVYGELIGCRIITTDGAYLLEWVAR